MPRTRRRAPRKRPRALKSPKVRLREMFSRVLDLEEPLREATRLVHALRLIGDGLQADGADEGPPIAEVARAAVGRLEELERVWVGALRVGRAA